MRRIVLAAATASSILASAAGCAHATAYTFTTIDVPGASGTVAQGINDAGQVVGYSYGGGERGFLYAGGRLVPIAVPGASATVPFAINDAGQVVGFYATGTWPDRVHHGFVSTSGGFATIDAPGTKYGTVVGGINDAGQVVGYYSPDGSGYRAFVGTTGGDFTPIGVPGERYGVALGINDAGQVVGYGDGVRSGGFMYAAGTRSPVGVPGAYETWLYGINDAGQIAGTYYADSSVFSGRAFVSTDGGATVFNVPGARQTHIGGINDAGQIVGYYSDDTGTHGFLATPTAATVPEPASVALLGVGFVGLVRRKRA